MPAINPTPAARLEFLVCSAIDYYGVVAVGKRHHNVIGDLSTLVGRLHWPITGTQGFLTSTGRFVNRAEGLEVATEANQIKNGKIIGGELTSEDLW